jgi:hypothetical protein
MNWLYCLIKRLSFTGSAISAASSFRCNVTLCVLCRHVCVCVHAPQFTTFAETHDPSVYFIDG